MQPGAKEWFPFQSLSFQNIPLIQSQQNSQLWAEHQARNRPSSNVDFSRIPLMGRPVPNPTAWRPCRTEACSGHPWAPPPTADAEPTLYDNEWKPHRAPGGPRGSPPLSQFWGHVASPVLPWVVLLALAGKGTNTLLHYPIILKYTLLLLCDYSFYVPSWLDYGTQLFCQIPL